MNVFDKIMEFFEPIAFIVAIVGAYWNLHYRIKAIERRDEKVEKLLETIVEMEKHVHKIETLLNERTGHNKHR